jgi:hypothetical protein
MATEEMFGRDGPAPPGTQVWVGGHLESAEALGQAFLEAADALAEVWRSGRRTASTDRLALPIIQTYRHAIELMLKAGCEKTAQLIGFGQELGYGQETRPADLEDELGSTHSIARLVTLLNDLLSGLADSGAGKMPTETASMLQYLHDLDEHGMAFRYASKRVGKGKMVKWEPVRPAVTLLDLDHATTQLHEAAGMLSAGLMSYLDAYEQWLQEMWGEYQSNLQSYADHDDE